VGAAVPAAGHAAKHLINGATIKNHTIAGAKLRKNTLSGSQINESTLGEGAVGTANVSVTATRSVTIIYSYWPKSRPSTAGSSAR
jgi:hypothetical protein